MSKKLEYVITLMGHEDTYYTLVSENVFNWIISPVEDSGHETVPDDVYEEMLECSKNPSKTVYVSYSTGENDRALNASGKHFDNMKDMDTFLKEHQLTIKDTFEGSTY